MASPVPTPPSSRRRSRVRSPGEPGSIGYLYILPAFAVYAAFLLWPFLRAVNLSLFDWDGVTLGRWVGLGNYGEAFRDSQLRAGFVHALVMMVFFAVLPLVIGLLLASVLHRGRVRALAFFRTVVFLPQVVAMVVIAVAWQHIYSPDGTVNSALRAVGLGSWARGWLGDYTLALPAVGLIGTWFETGLVTVLLLAGMSQIPTELYEAARLDGAGRLGEFRAITLPAVRGQIAVALTLTMIAALKTFDLIYMTTRGGPGNATDVPSYEVYHQAFDVGRVGLASAIGVVLTGIVFALSWMINRLGDREA